MDSIEFNLDDFKKYLLGKGLLYLDIDLLDLHRCLISNYLTIITGYSGIGKSILAKEYAQYMTNNDKSRYLMIPITPLYTDSCFLYGYYSYDEKIYKPDKNGFINLIRTANEEKNKNKIFYIIFDEINLAPVENWLSEILSVMESKENLKLYNAGETKGKLKEFIENEKNNIPPCIINKLEAIFEEKFNEYKTEYSLKNIKLIGTMNEDESGSMLTGRVLDRASKITLHRVDIDKLLKVALKDELGEFGEYFLEICEKLDETTSEVKIELDENDRDYSDIEKFKISPRIIINSLKSLKLLENNNSMTSEYWKREIDLILCDRVFSKLSANDNELLVKKWITICNLYNLDESFYKLNKIKRTLY